MSDLEQLVEMGFDKEKSQLAIKHGGGMQGAIDWLDKNQDKSIEEIQQADTKEDAQASIDAVAQSVVCDECGKRFRSFEQFGAHAERTGHQSVSESAEGIAPMTEEQKKNKMAELIAKRDARRAEQSKDDQATKQRNDEIRRKSNKEQQDAKEELKKKQQLKEASEKRREQHEDIAAKRRVQQRIKEDQENRRRKAAEEKASRTGQTFPPGPVAANMPPTAPVPTPGGAASTSKPASEYTETRLRLQTDNGTFQKAFSVTACLQEVAIAVSEEKSVDVKAFQQNFPKKVFADVDFGMTLKEAGLIPSAALIVKSD